MAPWQRNPLRTVPREQRLFYHRRYYLRRTRPRADKKPSRNGCRPVTQRPWKRRDQPRLRNSNGMPMITKPLNYLSAV